MSILTVQHLEKHFENTKVLNDISFFLEEGQALSIIGSSGSGKTTLLRCLNFLETPDAGTITVQDKVLFDADHHANCSEKEIRKNRLHFGMVFQSFNLFPQYTALENVTLARDVADQVIFMDGGFIVEQGDPKQVIDHPQEERTKQFLARFVENN